MDSAKAEDAAIKLAQQIRVWLSEEDRRATRLIGPAPCFFGRLGGYYRWQIVLCGPNPANLLRGRKLDGWKIVVNPSSLL